MQNNKEVQKKYLELEIILQQINQIHNEIVNLQNQILELELLKQNLNKFKGLKKGTNSYVPLGLNIFAKAELKENNEFLVAVGNNVIVKKNYEETIEFVNNYVEEIERILNDLQSQLNLMDSKGQELQQELQNLINKQ